MENTMLFELFDHAHFAWVLFWAHWPVTFSLWLIAVYFTWRLRGLLCFVTLVLVGIFMLFGMPMYANARGPDMMAYLFLMFQVPAYVLTAFLCGLIARLLIERRVIVRVP